MKWTPRKLGDPISPALLLKPNGTLAMADGSDPADYLKSYRRAQGFKGDVPISVCPITAMERIEFEVIIHRNHSA